VREFTGCLPKFKTEDIQLIMELEILGEIRDIETIATGRGVYIRCYLERTYGKGRWRKMKGIATIRLADGIICEAEIHWFEAHGIGRKDFKIKRVIR
jgi:hypothetical protein